MSPSAERLLRPVLAFLTLCLAAFLLSPTVASVHRAVDALDVQRELPFHLWKWYDEPKPSVFPDCGGAPRHLESEITQWPSKIEKDKGFTLRGTVVTVESGREGQGLIDVDIFLNATKEKPGVHLGEVQTTSGGWFELSTSVPFDLQAQRYHIVAHAKQKRIGCQLYLEHWSDPEVDVVTKSTIEWEAPKHVVAGRDVNLTGLVLDSVRGPVRNATVNVTLDGKTVEVKTDLTGRFTLEHRPKAPGEIEAMAEFKGNAYYTGARNATSFEVAEELFELDGEPLVLARGSAATISGHVYVADDVREDTIAIDLDGVNATACADCPVSDTFQVELAPDGAFAFTLTIPSSESPGVFPIDVSGGGLKRTYTSNVTVEVPTTLTLVAEGTGFFSRDYAGSLMLTDEAGRPVAGRTVLLATPSGSISNVTDAGGNVTFSGKADACGARSVDASFAGGEHVRGASATAPMMVCAFLAFIPPWLLAIPWWVWPLAVLAAFVAWRAVAAWRQRYAPTILGGPGLTLSFTEPADAAAGYGAIGEAIVATAFLEEPLPDGHHLRLGTYREAVEAPIDAELRAHLSIAPEKLGPMGIRAEVVDAKGRVVSRRTLTLKVVRYAEEIERRYLELREKSGASDAVTPREFERWLHARAPSLDAEIVRHLVRIFEEADYSPRTAGRADFAAYLTAERGMEQEVMADAAVA